MENSTWASGRRDVSWCRSERVQKPQNWNLPHFTSDAGGLSGAGGGKEPAEGVCGHQSLTAWLSCCLESWKGGIIIWICLLSQTHGTRKSLTWEKVLSASTYISYLAQKTAKKSTLWAQLDGMRLNRHLVLIANHHLYNHSDLLPPCITCFLVL